MAFLESLGALEALLGSTSPLVDSILELQGPPQISARTLEGLRTVKQARAPPRSDGAHPIRRLRRAASPPRGSLGSGSAAPDESRT